MSLYKQCKDMPNPSEGLIKLFKRKPYDKIWAMKSSYNIKGFMSLKKLKNLPLKNVELRVGRPHNTLSQDTKIKSRSFSGCGLKQHMFMGGRKQGDVCLVGIGHKSTGTWMIDVTERVIKELNEIGACALSSAHCKFELISPRVKQCKFCGTKLYKKTRVYKRIDWIQK